MSQPAFNALISQFSGIRPEPLEVSPSVYQVLEFMQTDTRLEKDIQTARSLFKQDILANKRKETGEIDTPRYDVKKKTLQGVTWAGVFSHRSNTKLVSSSGFLSFDYDFDKLQAVIDYEQEQETTHKLLEKLQHDKYIAVLFSSVSLIGFKGLVKIPLVSSDSEYKAYFRAFQTYLHKTYALTIDSLPDISRLCFLSYAPDMHVNTDSLVFDLREEQPRSEPATRTVLTSHQNEGKLDAAAAAAVNVLKIHGISQEISRNDFVGLCAVFQREQIPYTDFDDIMQKTAGYNAEENFKIWNSINADEQRSQVMTLATVVKMAKDADVETWNALFQNFSGNNGRPPHPVEMYEQKTNAPTSEATEPNKQPTIDGIHQTDLGNARRLVNLHGSEIRYCGELESWFLWNGKAWVKDVKQGIMKKAKETVRHIYKEASSIENDEHRQARVKWGRASESRKHLQDMIFLAQSEPELDINLSDMDGDPFLLNVKNGVIDLKTGDLLPHDKTRLLTKYVDIPYDKTAVCPVWETALMKYMGFTGNDPEKDERALVMMEFLQRAVGYTLTGDTSEKCFFFLHGNTGNNGKSTFTNILKLILGSYAKHVKIDALLQKKYDSIPNDIAMLPGARGVVSSEIPKGKRLNESLVKDLTGKDTISARFMRGEWFDFIPVFKLWIFGNDKPVVSPDDAIFSRVNLIPFDVHIPDHEIDKHFDNKLKKELPGILTWAVDGCLKWQKDGLMRTEEVVKATNEYRQEMDIVNDFIEEECTVTVNAKVSVKDLYESFTAWCERESHYPLRKREFNARIEKRPGIYKERGNYNAMTWHGIGKQEQREGES